MRRLTTDDVVQPCRDLVAAVLHQAHMDAATGSLEVAVDAFRWASEMHPAFAAYCRAIDINPRVMRDKFIELHSARCTPPVKELAALRAKEAKQAQDRKEARKARRRNRKGEQR